MRSFSKPFDEVVLPDSTLFSDRYLRSGMSGLHRCELDRLAEAYAKIHQCDSPAGYAEIESDFVAVQKSYGRHGPSLRGQAWAIFRQNPGDPQRRSRAIELLDEAFNEDSRDGESLVFKGQILSWSDQQAAADCWREALHRVLIRTWAETASGRLGTCLALQGKLDEAEFYLRLCHICETKTYECLATLAMISQKRGNSDHADQLNQEAEQNNWRNEVLGQRHIDGIRYGDFEALGNATQFYAYAINCDEIKRYVMRKPEPRKSAAAKSTGTSAKRKAQPPVDLPPEIRLTPQQLKSTDGAQLKELCLSILQDGKIDLDEVKRMLRWLRKWTSSSLPAVEHLRELMQRITADKVIDARERKELIAVLTYIVSRSCPSCSSHMAHNAARCLGCGFDPQNPSACVECDHPLPTDRDRLLHILADTLLATRIEELRATWDGDPTWGPQLARLVKSGELSRELADLLILLENTDCEKCGEPLNGPSLTIPTIDDYLGTETAKPLADDEFLLQVDSGNDTPLEDDQIVALGDLDTPLQSDEIDTTMQDDYYEEQMEKLRKLDEQDEIFGE